MIDALSQSILTILILFPVLASLVLIAIPIGFRSASLKLIGFFIALIQWLLSLFLVFNFDKEKASFQFAEIHNWLPTELGVKFIVGVDGLSLTLLVLVTTLSPLIFLSVYKYITHHIRGFLFLFFLMHSAMIGVFTALDVFQFYIFWELTLLPVLFFIGIWGQGQKIHATFKTFLYGVVGSLFMLLALVYLYVFQGESSLLGTYSTSLLDIYTSAQSIPVKTQVFLFLAISFSFAIKTPLFPFHSWLPDAYSSAPALYTLMSGVILKLAAYGFIRLNLCLFPSLVREMSLVLLILALISILYGALIAYRSHSLKKIMAFSSLSHLGLIILGIFSLNLQGLNGALYQMLCHAVTATALFVLIHHLFDLRRTDDIESFSGLAKSLPLFSFFFVIFSLASMALPSTGNFVGEWLILLGAFKNNPILGSLATLTAIFGAAYMLRVLYKIIFGPEMKDKGKLKGLSAIQVVQLLIFTVTIFLLGFFPNHILSFSQKSLLKIQNVIDTQEHFKVELDFFKKNDAFSHHVKS